MIELITELDFSVLYWIQDNIRTDFLDAIAAGLSIAFEGGIVWFAIAAILFVFRRTRAAGIMVICAMLLVLLVGEFGMKNIFCRLRPCHIDGTVPLAVHMPSSYSFPSGHTGSSFAAAGAIFAFNKKWGLPALVLALVVGLSRMYLFVHYPTDVLAGALLGLLCAWVVAFLFREFEVDRKIQSIGRKKSV